MSSRIELAKYIDHTLLKADANEDALRKLCEEARTFNFWSVCINPSWISTCAKELKGSNVKVCTVVGFPLGAMMSSSKAFEAEKAIDAGANEIDMVINIGALKSGAIDLVARDVRAVVAACGKTALSKVILEMCLLSPEEKVQAIKICMDEGASFVKTSTGFSSSGATVEDVRLMRETVGEKLGVKAAGGIRSYEDAIRMIEAGATRLGTSAGVKIVAGQATGNAGY
jgi:deoxyribose-phosphate aldolase